VLLQFSFTSVGLLLLLHDYSCCPEINVLLQLFFTVVGLLLLEAAQHSHSRTKLRFEVRREINGVYFYHVKASMYT
jgi:hypothetical protein